MAKESRVHIHTIYAGDKTPQGRELLRRVALGSNGVFVEVVR
jgi:hypothetical protein